MTFSIFAELSRAIQANEETAARKPAKAAGKRPAAKKTSAKKTKEMKLFHFSPAKFDNFDLTKAGSATKARTKHGPSDLNDGEGVYLTDSSHEGKNYGGNQYNVSFQASAEHLIKSDEPIDRQHKTVKAALSKIIKDKAIPLGKKKELTGGDVVKHLASTLGGAKAREVLLKSGIRGSTGEALSSLAPGEKAPHGAKVEIGKHGKRRNIVTNNYVSYAPDKHLKITGVTDNSGDKNETPKAPAKKPAKAEKAPKSGNESEARKLVEAAKASGLTYKAAAAAFAKQVGGKAPASVSKDSLIKWLAAKMAKGKHPTAVKALANSAAKPAAKAKAPNNAQRYGAGQTHSQPPSKLHHEIADELLGDFVDGEYDGETPDLKKASAQQLRGLLKDLKNEAKGSKSKDASADHRKGVAEALRRVREELKREDKFQKAQGQLPLGEHSDEYKKTLHHMTQRLNAAGNSTQEEVQAKAKAVTDQIHAKPPKLPPPLPKTAQAEPAETPKTEAEDREKSIQHFIDRLSIDKTGKSPDQIRKDAEAAVDEVHRRRKAFGIKQPETVNPAKPLTDQIRKSFGDAPKSPNLIVAVRPVREKLDEVVQHYNKAIRGEAPMKAAHDALEAAGKMNHVNAQYLAKALGIKVTRTTSATGIEKRIKARLTQMGALSQKNRSSRAGRSAS